MMGNLAQPRVCAPANHCVAVPVLGQVVDTASTVINYDFLPLSYGTQHNSRKICIRGLV